MLDKRPEVSDLDVELDLLIHENADYLNVVRLERFIERLRLAGPMAVTYSRLGFSRDRVQWLLEDHSVLRVKLYWPVRIPLVVIDSLTWREGVGWMIVGRSDLDERVVLYAWLIQIQPPIPS